MVRSALIGFYLPSTGSAVTVPRSLRTASPRGPEHPLRSSEILFDDSEHARLHPRRHAPVVRADRAAVVFPAPASVVAHQLVDHPGRDATVLQPGREGVPQVVGAVHVEAGEAGTVSGPPVDTAVVVDRQL